MAPQHLSLPTISYMLNYSEELVRLIYYRGRDNVARCAFYQFAQFIGQFSYPFNAGLHDGGHVFNV